MNILVALALHVGLGNVLIAAALTLNVLALCAGFYTVAKAIKASK